MNDRPTDLDERRKHRLGDPLPPENLPDGTRRTASDILAERARRVVTPESDMGPVVPSDLIDDYPQRTEPPPRMPLGRALAILHRAHILEHRGIAGGWTVQPVPELGPATAISIQEYRSAWAAVRSAVTGL